MGYFLSFFLSDWLTSKPLLRLQSGLCNQKQNNEEIQKFCSKITANHSMGEKRVNDWYQPFRKLWSQKIFSYSKESLDGAWFCTSLKWPEPSPSTKLWYSFWLQGASYDPAREFFFWVTRYILRNLWFCFTNSFEKREIYQVNPLIAKE